MGNKIDIFTLFARSRQQISGVRKKAVETISGDRGDVRDVCKKDTKDLFVENLVDSLKETKRTFKMSKSNVQSQNQFKVKI